MKYKPQEVQNPTIIQEPDKQPIKISYTHALTTVLYEKLYKHHKLQTNTRKKLLKKKRNKLNFNKLPYQQVSVEKKIQKLNPRDYEENGYHQVNQIKELK